jgi:ATPase subunit of ABC transporter with duplicated ATPase domains
MRASARARACSVLMVSHDQHFISSTAAELWVVDGARKTVHRTEGGFRDYKELLLKSLAGPAHSAAP